MCACFSVMARMVASVVASEIGFDLLKSQDIFDANQSGESFVTNKYAVWCLSARVVV